MSVAAEEACPLVAKIVKGASLRSDAAGVRASVAITGAGLCSSLGDLVTACAAARAGVSRPLDMTPEDMLPPDPGPDEIVASVVGHPVPNVAGFRGEGRLVALAEQALIDLLAQDPEEEERSRLGFHLCLPDPKLRRLPPDPEADELDPRQAAREDQGATDALLARILAAVELPVAGGDRRVHLSGAPGLATAIDEAMLALEAGELDGCIVGAIDSQLDDDVLALLADAGRLKGPEASNGLMPGEAAVVLRLERPDVARSRRRATLATISATATAQGEDVTAIDRPPRGTALVELLAALTRARGPLPPGGFWFLTDQNGETFRALEWGDFILRASGRYPGVSEAPLWYPAIAFGDTGAASGALGIAMAVRAFAGSYAPATSALVLSSSLHGGRSVVRVDRPR